MKPLNIYTVSYAVSYTDTYSEPKEFGVCDFGSLDEKKAWTKLVEVAEEKFNSYVAEHMGEEEPILTHDDDWACIDYPDGSKFECKVSMVTVEVEG